MMPWRRAANKTIRMEGNRVTTIPCTTNAQPLKPIFRWAGSKRKSLPTLAEFWNASFRRYIEPFAGSAALFFHLRPDRALLGDINGALIETYRVIRDRPDDVHRALVRIPRSEADYYRIRKQVPNNLQPFARAVRFTYLNRLCFNGIYRTNGKGQFNVPYAHTRAGGMPSIEAFRQCAAALNGATLARGDFGKILARARKGDFVYLDPPYAVSSRRIFAEYDKRAFTTDDLERLAIHLKNIDAAGAKFVVSYADCREARDLMLPWKTRRIRVRRNVAGFIGARRFAVELLATNIESEG